MKVVIDLSPLRSGHQYRGIGVYTKNLYKALQKYDTANEYVLTTNTYQANADVIHYPFFDFYFLTLPFNKQKNTVITIHDVIPLIFKEHYPAGKRGDVKYWFQRQSLKGVTRVITDSQQSKEDIQKYLNVSSEKISSVHLAASEELKPMTKKQVDTIKQKYGLTKPYVLYVGDINYNKNLPRLIKCFSQAQSPFDLVLVSKALSQPIREAQEIRRLIQHYDLEGKVKILTRVPIKPLSELASLYTGAYFYIQPSLYEGFGLPVLEAWACKTPVLSSNAGSLKEIVTDHAIVFDPSNESEMVKAIASLGAMSKQQRNNWIRLGEKRNKDFSWKKTALETSRIYQSLLS